MTPASAPELLDRAGSLNPQHDLFLAEHAMTPAERRRLKGGPQAKGYAAQPGKRAGRRDLPLLQPPCPQAPRQDLSEVRAHASVLDWWEGHRRARVRASLPELEITLRFQNDRGREVSALESACCRCRAISSSDSQSSSGAAWPSRSTTICRKLASVVAPGFGIGTESPIARIDPCNFKEPRDIFTVAPGYMLQLNTGLSSAILDKRLYEPADPLDWMTSLTAAILADGQSYTISAPGLPVLADGGWAA